jgi:2-dehydropantoate 2-reductase
MRIIIYGAGAIGGGIGARLHQHGKDTVLIARGPHLDAMRRDGLTLRTPDETVNLKVPAVGHPSEIDWHPDDVVLLTMKSQDTQDALETLRDTAGDVPVICAQNGVANERMAARLFSRVYGMVVWMPATHLAPGEVIIHSAPASGLLDAGCYPQGVDHLIDMATMKLRESGFVARPDSAIMRMKYAKLQTNLANTCALWDLPAGIIVTRLREALMATTPPDDSATVEDLRGLTDQVCRYAQYPVSNAGWWLDMAEHEHRPSLETDYLNGEISPSARCTGRRP